MGRADVPENHASAQSPLSDSQTPVRHHSDHQGVPLTDLNALANRLERDCARLDKHGGRIDQRRAAASLRLLADLLDAIGDPEELQGNGNVVRAAICARIDAVLEAHRG
jgi:hypothetical protein